MIWTEKYRPKKVSEMVGEFKAKVLKYLEKPDEIPHFLFYSKTPGTGKTTLAKAIINELDCDYIVVNSSDDRKLEVIRDRVKQFAITKSSKTGLRRCVFLDEIDGMWGPAKASQEALRNIMESYAKNVFFILTCVNKGTNIYTPFGFKRVENIKSELVLTDKQSLVNKSVIQSKKNKLLVFKTLHGNKISVTPEHKFFINNEWVEAQYLNEGDRIDIMLDSVYGNNIELENNKYKIFSDKVLSNFNNFLIKEKIPSEQILNKIIEYRNKNLLPQEIDLYEKLEAKKEYTIFDIMKLDDNNLKKHRYNNMIGALRKVGAIQVKGNNRHTRYIKKDIKINNFNFYKIVKLINQEFNYKYNTKEIYNLYRHHTRLTIEDVLIELKKIIDIESLNYEKISVLGRILGFIYGDGYLDENSLQCAGNKDCLELVKKDILLFFSKDINIIKNGYHDGNGWTFKVSNKSLALFLKFLGCPIGAKVGQPMYIPKICYTNKLLMKNFIQSLFDCESVHITKLKDKKLISIFRFGQRTTIGLVNGKDKFFNELKYVLRDFFNIESYIRYNDVQNNGQFEPKQPCQARVEKQLLITKSKDIINLMKNIGNYYEGYKKRLDLFGYLLYKNQNNCFGYKFLSFNKWKNKFFDNGILKDEIINIEEQDGKFEVYDLSLDEVHSYISNGFISHNCNNINKVTDPIKSRCKVIPFAYPNREEIHQYLTFICEREEMQYTSDGIAKLIDINYPSIRNCVVGLQDLKIENQTVSVETVVPVNAIFDDMWKALKDKKWQEIKKVVLESTVDPRELNTHFWQMFLEQENIKGIQITCRNEKDISWGADAKIVFVTSLIELVK